MTFPDFQTSGMVPELFYKNGPDSLYIGCKGTLLPMVI